MTLPALVAFARQVHFIADRATVLERAVEVVEAETGAPWVAAYAVGGEGFMLRAAAAGQEPFGSPDAVDEDDPALIAVRADRGAVDGPAGSVLAGTLVLPFITAAGCTGLISVGPAERPFAPSEREALAAAAQAVGLALDVLQVRALREEVASWRERAQWAEHELAVLHRVLDHLPVAESAPAQI